MIAAEPAEAWRFSRVNRRGTFQKTRASATGCPGIAASSPTCSLLFEREQDGPLATAGLPVRGREIANGQLALANVALVARESGSAVGPKRSFRRHAVIRLRRKPRTNAVGVAGPGRISIWSKNLSPRICADSPG